MALKNFRSNTRTFEDERPRRGNHLYHDDFDDVQYPPSRLSQQEHVDDVERAVGRRTPSYSLSSQDEGTDEQSSIQYADSIHIQYLESICYRLHREKAVCMNIIRELKEKLASAEEEIQKLDSALSVDQSGNSSASSNILLNGKETNEGKLTALEAENEMLRKKIAEMEQERVADKLKVAQPSNGFSPAPIAS